MHYEWAVIALVSGESSGHFNLKRSLHADLMLSAQEAAEEWNAHQRGLTDAQLLIQILLELCMVSEKVPHVPSQLHAPSTIQFMKRKPKWLRHRSAEIETLLAFRSKWFGITIRHSATV